MGRPYTKAPGLDRMVQATPAGKCPFCLDPIPGYGIRIFGVKPRVFCGDPVCRTAYHRTRKRDVRRGDTETRT